MSESYSPAPGAVPQAPYSTVFLSQRDVGLQVPINFVTTPGISFTAACFAHLRYEDDDSGDCLSNLLAVGIRRFEIDLFWDQGRQVWSFCPVAIPTSIPIAARALTAITLNGNGTHSPMASGATLISPMPNTVGANLLYVTINVHAAADTSFPLLPAPMPSAFPQPPNLLSTLFSDSLSAYIYTPSELASNRMDINGSWYTVPEEFRPIQAFYSTQLDENDIASTEDGWPTEGYIEFTQSKRLLLGFGTVDPQMSRYNITGDHNTIFPTGYIQNGQRDINATSSGQLTQGCYFLNNTDNLSKTNSSWAIGSNIAGFDYPTSPSSDLTPFLNLTSNLTTCGISSFLNATLLNYTANENFMPYESYSYASIWSWAPGEPKNQSSNNDVSPNLFRCAMSKIDLAGRWVVNDCSSKTYASCRAHNQPYNWSITTYPITYSYAEQACPSGYTFTVPRTAMENSYLFEAMKSSNRDYDQNGVWVDWNSLNTAGCWVTGSNTTCPYVQSVGLQGAQYTRYVIPVVAAIIVLCIASLTLFVKLVGHRQLKRRTRKRVTNGAVYEGVPS
ncbi:hypothetical protein OIDMADRAFT_152418 [Oidiodendron maius Zn]|uniref:Maintenance of telomere capping protein 6 n=1 Tax=Oidiodendron maius (strain Zn) TaxID=913774 RepID=A0A0C3DA75_OIDMZ|nr:hypothetical protein OIDMADRAFT_152418 [Oidiodendron maius Zn]